MKKRQVVIPRLEVVRRGEVIRTIPVNRSRIVIGSERGAHLRLKHPAILPRHLEIVVVNGRYLEAANLAGEGRVLLGNQPMNRARLREGDELDLGPVTLRLNYDRTPSMEGPIPFDDTASLSIRTDTIDSLAPSDTESADSKSATDFSALDPEEQDTVEGTAPTDQEEETTGFAGLVDDSGFGERTLDDLPELDSLQSTSTDPPLVPMDKFQGNDEQQADTDSKIQALDEESDSIVPELDVELGEMTLDPVPVVVIEPPGGRPQRVPLRVGSFVVGAGRCAFRLSYPGVAPAHVEVMVMPDGVVYLKHLAGSGLLTLRNGAPIQFSRWGAGDRVQVGPVALKLNLVSAADGVVTDPVATPAAVPPPQGSTSDPDTLGTMADEPTPFRQRIAGEPKQRRKDRFGFGLRSGSALPSLSPRKGTDGTKPEAEVASADKEPLVRVHKDAKKKTKKKARKSSKKKTSSPLVTTNTVEVDWAVSTFDPLTAIGYGDSDWTEFKKPLWQRAAIPLLALLLSSFIVFEVVQYLYPGALKEMVMGSAAPTVAQTASGSAGINRDDAGVLPIGERVVQVGEPRSRRGSATRGRARGASDPASRAIDWDDNRGGILFENRVPNRSIEEYEEDFVAKPAAVDRPEDSLNRSDAVVAPTPSGGQQGWVDMDVVNNVLGSGRRKLQHCYRQAREDDETLQGILWLNMTLGTDGRIRGVIAEARSTLQSASMLKCMERRLFSLDMPKAKDGPVTFSVPFEFSPTSN